MDRGMDREKEILLKLDLMDEKLNLLITKGAVSEHRIEVLEASQKGVIRFTLAAILTSLGAIISTSLKYIVGG